MSDIDVANKILDAFPQLIKKKMSDGNNAALSRLEKIEKFTLYKIRGERPEEVLFEFDKSRIPYIQIRDTNLALIEDSSLTVMRCKSLNKKVLQKRRCFMQEMTSDELQNAISNHDKIKNKNIVTIKGLNEKEYDALYKYLNDISPNFLVGTNDTPSSYSVAFPEVLTDNVIIETVGDALFKAMFRVYGESAKVKDGNKDFDMWFYDAELCENRVRENINEAVGVILSDSVGKPSEYIKGACKTAASILNDQKVTGLESASSIIKDIDEELSLLGLTRSDYKNIADRLDALEISVEEAQLTAPAKENEIEQEAI